MSNISPTFVRELGVDKPFITLLLLATDAAFLRGVLLIGGGGVKYEESNLIFLVVFVTKAPLELPDEADNFEGLALGVLPASLATGTAVITKLNCYNLKLFYLFL